MSKSILLLGVNGALCAILALPAFGQRGMGGPGIARQGIHPPMEKIAGTIQSINLMRRSGRAGSRHGGCPSCSRNRQR